ncbi:unnamed protein product, partial [Brachionus calyciflorus]
SCESDVSSNESVSCSSDSNESSGESSKSIPQSRSRRTETSVLRLDQNLESRDEDISRIVMN